MLKCQEEPTNFHNANVFMKPTFTCLDALCPRMLDGRIIRIPTVVEPITAASTAAKLAGFLDSATFDAHGLEFCWLCSRKRTRCSG